MKSPISMEDKNATKNLCKIHSGEVLVSFCTEHATMLCQKCCADHQNCRYVKPLDGATATNGTGNVGANFSSIENGIKSLNLILDGMLSKKDTNISDIRNKKKHIKKTILEAKKKICDYLDKLVKTLENEIDEQCDTIIERIKKEKVKISNKRDELKQFTNNIAKSLDDQTAERKQELHAYQESLQHLEECIISLEKDDKHLDLHLKLSDNIFKFETTFPNFGQAIISEKIMIAYSDSKKTVLEVGTNAGKCDWQIRDHVHDKAKDSPSKPVPGKLILVSTFPTSVLGKGVKIFRGCFLPDNSLILAAYQEKSLYICNKDGKACKRVRVANFPGGVALFNKSSAVVSAWQHGIQRVDLKTQKATDKIRVYGECSAISTKANKICVKNSDEHLTVLDGSGKILQKLPTMHNPWEIYFTDTGCVYYSNLQNNNVHCVFPDGSNYLTYSDHDLEDPAGLAVDNQDCLYISGSRSNNIHRISGDRTMKEVVLSSNDDIRSPSGMAFNNQTDELLIINDEFSSVRIYRVVF